MCVSPTRSVAILLASIQGEAVTIVSAVTIVPSYRSDSPRGYRGEPITGLSPINAVTADAWGKLIRAANIKPE